MRPLNGGRDIPAAPSGDGFASASSATTASPDDDAAAPPSTAGGSLSSTNNQRSRVPGEHAGASDADYSAGTGATCTARAPLCHVSFRFTVLISGSCNCCCGERLLCPCPGAHHPARVFSRWRRTTRRTTPWRTTTTRPTSTILGRFRLTRRAFVFVVVS